MKILKQETKSGFIKKKKQFTDKGKSTWSENRYTVNKIEDVPNAGKLYHVDGMPKPMLRAELLL